MTDPLASSPALIAIVEEQQAMAELLRSEFAAEGYHTVHVPGYLHIADYLAMQQADLLVVDIHLSRQDGWSLLQELRTNPATVNLPIVIASPGWNRPGLRRLPKGGPVRFSGKPFELESMLHLVRELLQEAAKAVGPAVTR